MESDVWRENGVVIETMTEEECQAGGVWVVGNRRPDGHPGKTDGSLCVKSWIALPDKYGPGRYTPKDRFDEGLWETVWVLDGQLACTVDKAGRRRRVVLGHPGPLWIELEPDALRSWELPDGCVSARGITLCTRGVRWPPVEVRPWIARPPEVYFTTPLEQLLWHARYAEVFQGRIHCTPLFGPTEEFTDVHGRHQERFTTPPLTLSPGQRMFLAPWAKVLWGYDSKEGMIHGILLLLG